MFQCDVSGKYDEGGGSIGSGLTIIAPYSYENDEMGFDDFTPRCVLAALAAARFDRNSSSSLYSLFLLYSSPLIASTSFHHLIISTPLLLLLPLLLISNLSPSHLTFPSPLMSPSLFSPFLLFLHLLLWCHFSASDLTSPPFLSSC
jgi:hypothetical protein